MEVVGEHHAVADEDLVLHDHALAHEAVRGDLAARADRGVLLDLDEGPDPGVVADRAAVEVHERRVRDPHVLAEPHAVADRHLTPRSVLSSRRVPGWSGRCRAGACASTRGPARVPAVARGSPRTLPRLRPCPLRDMGAAGSPPRGRGRASAAAAPAPPQRPPERQQQDPFGAQAAAPRLLAGAGGIAHALRVGVRDAVAIRITDPGRTAARSARARAVDGLAAVEVDPAIAIVVDAVLALRILDVLGRGAAPRIGREVDEAVAIVVDAVVAGELR